MIFFAGVSNIAMAVPGKASDDAQGVDKAMSDIPEGNLDSGMSINVKLENPLKVDNIQDAIKFIVNTLIKISIPIIVVFFIWSGLKFILAQGNPTKVADAKKMFWYTIIGTLLILGAYTITNAIVGTVNTIID